MFDTSFSSRRVVSVLLAVLLVTSGLGGFVAPATASHECDLSDSALALLFSGPSLIGEATGGSAVGCDIWHDEIVDQDQTDAQQVRLDIYASARDKQSQTQVLQSTYDNYMEDSRTTALLVGKNAYIRALENGTSKENATSFANSSVEDYYTKKQINQIISWNSTYKYHKYIYSRASNESNVSTDFVDKYDGTGTSYWETYEDGGEITDVWIEWHPGSQIPSAPIGLINGSSKNAVEVDYRLYSTVGDQSRTWTAAIEGKTGGPPNTGNTPPGPIYIQPPTENHSEMTYHDGTVARENFDRLKTLSTDVKGELKTFVDNTYQEVQNGTINSSDLVDPYLGSRSYSPSGDYQTWALSSLQSLGLAGPMNLSEVGHMEVLDLETNETHNGILLSDGLPQGDEFVVGETYNAANISGSQFVVTNSQQVELAGEFTIESAVNTSGSTQDSVVYRNVSYDTATAAEYGDLMDQLAETSAEIEARENQLGGGGGGGGLLGDTPTVVIVAVAAVAGLLLLKD